MRRLLAFGSAAIAAFAVVRLLTGRRRSEPAPVETGSDPRAEELRRKLAESRAVVDEREQFESGETPVDEAEPAADLDARRRAVHEDARSVVEQMQRDPSA